MVTILWVGFVLLILLLLLIDLGVLNRKAHEISIREALGWTGLWVALAMVFNVGVYFMYEHHLLGIGEHIGKDTGGAQAAMEFLAGYITEKSLSVDNIFVIALIFSYFKTPLRYQHRVLFWGVLGALVMRGVMIALGVALIHTFEWVTYVFGALLLISAAKMLVSRHDNLAIERNPIIRLVHRLVTVTDDDQSGRFITRVNGSLAVTPLFVVLMAVEATDLIFAVDSIPAIFAITDDPFIVFTSNVFAILGLRSLYFALAGLMQRLRYLKVALVILLAFIGVKMLVVHVFEIPTWISLLVITGILAAGTLASIFAPPNDPAAPLSPIAENVNDMMRWTMRRAWRIIMIVTGSVVLLVGVIMLVTPGPAILVIPLGLTILAGHVAWARRFLQKIKAIIESYKNDSSDSS